MPRLGGLYQAGGVRRVAEDKDTKRGPQISVGFRQEDLDDLRAVAEQTDTPVATLIRQWTLERLRQIKPRQRYATQESSR